MAKEISFKDLPFVPVEGQVIYVEQSYNDKLNKFIRNNYEWLKATFRNQGLEFCFLELLAEESITYNAPYLRAEEVDNQINSVHSLADYIAGDSGEVVPSLVFALDIPVADEAGHTILQMIPVKTRWYTSTRSTFAALAKEIRSVSKEQSKKYHEIERNRKAEEAARKRRREEEERRKQNADEGRNGVEGESRSLSEVRFSLRRGRRDDIHHETPGEKPDSSSTDTSKLGRKARPGVKFSLDVQMGDSILDVIGRKEDADYNFDSESKLLIDEIRQRIAALRNRGVNTMFLHNLIDDGEHLSRLYITREFRIFLVDYNNLEIKMPVLPKAVFILFLRHPEGIRFKELSDFYSELLQIYLKMNPNGSRMKNEQSIRDITDPCSNSINEKCARIREAFVSNFDDRLAKNYYVTGKRGEAKRIVLDESMILWE